jgi:hypothetical protein
MSSVLYDILGGGGLDKTYTDWTSARAFVKSQIRQNPRLWYTAKEQLLVAEEEAYQEATTDRNIIDWLGDLIDLTPSWFQATSPIDYYTDNRELAQIGFYFDTLKEVFPTITNDSRFLAIFDAASEVDAQKIDQTITSQTKFKLPTWAWLALGFGVYRVVSKK